MASDNETVEEVLREMNSSHEGMIAFEFMSYADRIEAAHRRELDKLNFELMTAKSEQKTAANVIIEQTNKVEKLECEIAELRELLVDAAKLRCGECWHLINERTCPHSLDGDCEAIRWLKAAGAENLIRKTIVRKAVSNEGK